MTSNLQDYTSKSVESIRGHSNVPLEILVSVGRFDPGQLDDPPASHQPDHASDGDDPDCGHHVHGHRNDHTQAFSSWSYEAKEPLSVEIYFSIIQRKVLPPNDFANLEAVQLRLTLSEDLSNQCSTPFQWKFDRLQLTTLLAKIEAHQKRFAAAQLHRSAEAA